METAKDIMEIAGWIAIRVIAIIVTILIIKFMGPGMLISYI